MQFEYKDMKNRQARDKASELLMELPLYVQSFIVGREGRMSSRTQYIYISRIDTFYRYLTESGIFGSKEKKDITLEDLDTLRVEHIEAFASWIRHGHVSGRKKDDKETTVNNYLSAVSVFYKYFANRGKLSSNPVSGVERGKPAHKEVIRLNDRQKTDFFSCIENGDFLTDHQKIYHDKSSVRDYALCLVLTRTGLRVSELVGLNVDDVDFEDCSLTVLRKGNKYDTVFFDDEVKEVLMEYMDFRKDIAAVGEKALFVVTIGKYLGTRISVRSVQRLVKKYAEAGAPVMGSRITPHKLRATYATDMLVATNNLALVQKALNHESPKTTLVYADQRTIDLEKARNTLIEDRE